MTGDTSKPAASRRRALLHVEENADLRNSATPPFEPAIASLPPGVSSLYGAKAPFGSAAFATRDALDITPSIASVVAQPVSGKRVRGSLWPSQRFELRVPTKWNGRLVVAGCPGQRTEFAFDRLFGDLLVSRGYAYACGNKGNGDGALVLENGVRVAIDGVDLPRFPIPGGRAIAFWQHAPGHTIDRWLTEMLALNEVARDFLEDAIGRAPGFVYAIGLSNGGYQVRRAVEECDAFDGALTWNAVLWTQRCNLLDSLSGAITAMERGEPGRLAELGFPPDVAATSGGGSLYLKNMAAYWYVTLWLHAMQIDPEASIAYGDVSSPEIAESWCARISQWRSDRSPEIARRIARFENTGSIRCKLVELASEYDHLIPPRLHFEPYRKLVETAGKSASYRAVLIPKAQHVDSWADDPQFPGMLPGLPVVVESWEKLILWVEGGRVKSW